MGTKRERNTCIYCLTTSPEATFEKAEHVIPQSFGVFRNNLTLRGVVCDACNQLFGDSIDLYLARDTPDGIDRFRLGGKPASGFKSLGARSMMSIRVDSGPLKGSEARLKNVDGELVVVSPPQVGFGRTESGPYEWFPRAHLPDVVRLRALVEAGNTWLHFQDVTDRDEVLAELHSLGVRTSDVGQTSQAHSKYEARVEVVTKLEHTFGRAITKIALNYLASQYGASVALLPQFDATRRFVLLGEIAPQRLWHADNDPFLEGADDTVGHTLALGWFPSLHAVQVQLSFHGTARYVIQLSTGTFQTTPFHRNRCHFFNLKTKEVIEFFAAN